MAGLCEGGNEPPGSLKPVNKWNHCIHVFSAEGKYLRQLGRKGHASGCFHSPEGIASGPGISEKTSLYVCDTGNDRVQVSRVGQVIRLG
ncbi:tripartite motif-containing protein 3-like isoform X2 [Periplaneta americana]|uniref:tripartite motif-containing protein 3-like isoform X2 n=1 Tax=Periplaneta americana TaxID=6978 RepID=UPI0037E86582